MRWIIDDLKMELSFFKYRITHGPQTEKVINEGKGKVADLELAIKTLEKKLDTK